MFAVVSCKKYSRSTLRVVDFGNLDKAQGTKLLKGYKGMECPLCGPCSHVELTFNNYFDFHSFHESLSDAKAAAVRLSESSPGAYECPSDYQQQPEPEPVYA